MIPKDKIVDDIVPDLGLETLIRKFLISEKETIQALDEVLETAEFYDELIRLPYGSLGNYLCDLMTIPDTYSYLSVILLYATLVSERQDIIVLPEIKKEVQELKLDLQTLLETLPTDLEGQTEEIKNFIKSTESSLNIHSDKVSAGVVTAVGVLLEPLGVALTGIAGELTGIAGSVAGIETTVVGGFESVNNAFLSLNNKIDKKFENIDETIKEAVKEAFEGVGDGLGMKVADFVVGESYYKWDSCLTYFPSVTYIFLENTIAPIKRKVQIRSRWEKKANEVTEEEIERLKGRISRNGPFEYSHGITRANFQSKKKIWKTTIYTDTGGTAQTVIKTICENVFEPFDPDYISYTVGRKRPNSLRRRIPTASIPINYQDYTEDFRVKLKRVVLLLNGAAKPITLWSQN